MTDCVDTDATIGEATTRINGFNDRTQTVALMGRTITYEAALALVVTGRDPLVSNVLTDRQKALWITRLTTKSNSDD